MLYELLNVTLPLIDLPGPTAPPGADKILVIVGWISWFAVIAGVIGIIIVGISMFFNHHQGRGSSEAAGKLGYVFGGLVLIGAAGTIVSAFLPSA